MRIEAESRHLFMITHQGVDTTLYLPDPEDHIQARIIERRCFYEQELLDDIVARVPAGGLAIDAGANIGNHSVFLAQHAGLKVYAFEPHPELFEILAENVRLNGLTEQVKLFKAGVGGQAEQRGLSVMDANNLGKTMLLRRRSENPVAEVMRLDDLELEQPVTLIKLDIEGMELEALRGATAILERDRPLIYVEAKSPLCLSALETLLLRYGYTVLDRFNDTPTYLFVPVQDDKQLLLTLSKRLGELYRDVRVLNDRVASQGKATQRQSEQGARELLERVEQLAKLTTGLESQLGRQAEPLTAMGRQLAVVSERSKELQHDWLPKQFQMLDDGIKQLEQAFGAMGGRLEEAFARTLEAQAKANQVAQDRRQAYFSDAYRRKLEAVLNSFTWRSMARLRRLFGGSSLTAAEYFAKVEKKAPPQRRLPPPRRMGQPSIAASAFAQKPKTGHGLAVSQKAEVLPGRFVRANPTELTAENSTVTVGIAALPERESALGEVVASLLPQVDTLCVYLNGWEHVPGFLESSTKIKVARSQDHGDHGDAGKFFWVDDCKGFYLTCDDDIRYCSDYVARCVAKLKAYQLSAAVGWHGSLLRVPFEDYYQKSSRRVFSFEADRPVDTAVHILGTGCLAFHTSTIKVRWKDFERPNMADVFFARLAQQQAVPLYVIEHAKTDLVAIEQTQESSISRHSMGNQDTQKNTRTYQNQIVSGLAHWQVFEWAPVRLLLVGRFAQYTKGGIHKSCKLIEEALTERGNTVYTWDLADALTALPGPTDIAWIYPGDPARPDYATVDEKIRFLQEAGVPTLVNFSYVDLPERSAWIAEQLARYNSDPSRPAVMAATFTESVVEDAALKPWASHVVFVPKTIDTGGDAYDVPFTRREGIVFGDATKLTNPTILGGPAAPWIEACRARLPSVNLYAYKQYSGKDPHSHLTPVPHMQEGFAEWLSERRIFVCLNRHLTFEMVACEAQQQGVPVVYRHMPHSLSEYIGPTGVRVRSPEELAEACAWLYNDEGAWRQFSGAAYANGASVDVRRHAANLEVALRLAGVRAKQHLQQAKKK